MSIVRLCTLAASRVRRLAVACLLIGAASLVLITACSDEKDSPAGPNPTTPTPLSCSISRATPGWGEAPLEVSFRADATGGTKPYTYAWTFDDGDSSDQQEIVHTFADTGSYTVMLTVEDAKSQTCSKSITIEAGIGLLCQAEGSPLGGPAPLQVDFTGSATGGKQPYTYVWNFGDGGSGDQAATSHTYTSDGVFTAAFVVSDASGLACTSFVTIGVGVPLTCTSSASVDNGLAPLEVQFSANVYGGMPPYARAWDFGDGASDSALSGSHTYSMAGVYDAAFTVVDAGNDTCQGTHTITVTEPLSCEAAVDVAQAVIEFTANFTSTVSGGTPPYTYFWDFMDDGTSILPNPSHIFDEAGTYDVSLTVTDDLGLTCASVVVVQADPAAGLQCNITPQAAQVIVMNQVIFAAVIAGGVTPYTYSWDFGDGDQSTEMQPSHTYVDVGSYTVTLTVTDKQVNTSTCTATVEVLSEIQCSISAVPLSGPAPLDVAFAASVSGGADEFSFDWDFGDGQTSAETNPGHRYNSAGTYTVTLTARDKLSNPCTSDIVITVTAGLSCSPAVTPTSGEVPLEVQFTAGPVGGYEPYTYDWNFDDGTPHDLTANPRHTYQSIGDYHPAVTITDNKGVVCGKTLSVSVVRPALSCDAAANPTSGMEPLTVSFAATASGGWSPYTYSWNFGDGNTSTLKDPEHTYTSGGTYDAVLTVKDQVNATCTKTIRITVATAPRCVVTVTPSVFTVPQKVTINAQANFGVSPYSWEFALINPSGIPTVIATVSSKANFYTFEYTVLAGQKGTYTLLVNIEDGSIFRPQTCTAETRFTIK